MRTPTNERLTPDIAEPEQARQRHSGSEKRCPQRRCILTGETAPRDRLLRLAISPEGEVLPDPMAKAPGRGAWIGVSRAELEQAMAMGKLRGALARAFKGASLVVPSDLPDRITTAFSKALCNRLGLELRAGTLVLGSDRIAEQARMGNIALLLHASDASDSGRSRLDQAWRVGNGTEGSGLRGIVLPLDRAALSVALGRDNVVHLGVTGREGNDRAAERIRALLSRLLYFQSELPGEEDDAPRNANGAAVPTVDGNRKMNCEG